ncbi:MAG: ATP-grasp domain-containing protein [bacterium]
MSHEKLINILFLGGAKRVSLAERFMEAGEALHRKINIFSYELTTTVPIAAVAKKIIVGLQWKDDGILEHLSATIRKHAIDIVLPFVDSSVMVAGSLKKREKDIFIPVSERSVSERFFDKTEADTWFVNNGFPTPAQSTTIPVIAKVPRGSASKGIFIIKTDAQWRFFIDNFDPKNYLIQQFIEGNEYSVDCYVSSKGTIVSVVPRERIEVIDGEVTQSITVRDHDIITLANKILEKCECRGPVTIQIIKEKGTEKLFIIEINPRFGGGVPLSIEAGANIPLLLLQDYVGIANQVVDNWRENVLMTRAYREVFHYANNR